MLSVLACLLALPAAALEAEPALWQESVLFDALLPARERMARQQSDPKLVPMMKAVASQAAQQIANMEQIESYVKSQQDNLKYAFAESDPEESLKTIQDNFGTLSTGSEQIRQNLYYLTARCRMAATQALIDPEVYDAGLLILGQIQELQLKLNNLYLETVNVQNIIAENQWAVDKHFNHDFSNLMANVMRIQDSVFAVYNSAYDLSMRSR